MFNTTAFDLNMLNEISHLIKVAKGKGTEIFTEKTTWNITLVLEVEKWCIDVDFLFFILIGYFFQLADPGKTNSFSGNNPRAFTELPFHLVSVYFIVNKFQRN